MKNIIFVLSIFLICLTVINCLSNSLNRENCKIYNEIKEKRQTRIYENEIISYIEKMRDQLKNKGLPEFGITSLDPLNLDENFQVDIENLVNFDLNTTLHSEGLLGFEIEKLKIGLIGLKIDFIINWPILLANGTYGLDASTPLVPIKLFGNGDVDMKATNLKIVGSGNLKTKMIDGKLNILIGKAEIDIQLEKFNIKISGVLGSDAVSKLVSDGLSVALPNILKELKGDLNKALEQALETINEWIINQNIFGRNIQQKNIFDSICENVL